MINMITLPDGRNDEFIRIGDLIDNLDGSLKQQIQEAIDAAPRYSMKTRAMVDLHALMEWLPEQHEDVVHHPEAVLDGIIEKAVSMAEHVNTIELIGSDTACDNCEVGKLKRCGHAYGRHYDVWGEGLGTPDYCPQKCDDLPW